MKKTVCKLVYKGINNLVPPLYNNMFNLARYQETFAPQIWYLPGHQNIKANLVKMVWHIVWSNLLESTATLYQKC